MELQNCELRRVGLRDGPVLGVLELGENLEVVLLRRRLAVTVGLQNSERVVWVIEGCSGFVVDTHQYAVDEFGRCHDLQKRGGAGALYFELGQRFALLRRQ